MFVTRALVVLAAAAATAFAAKVDVSILPTENLAEDVTPLPVAPIPYQHADTGNYRRQAVFGRAFFRDLVAQAGYPFLDPPHVVENANANGVDIVDGITVQSTHLLNSSIAHVDKIEGTGERVRAGSRIAFVMLNTNDKAHFDVDGQCIPIVEGSLVTFDGSHTHQTVVRRGNVDLAGPFQISTMASVSVCVGDCPPIGCQNGGTCDTCANKCNCSEGWEGDSCTIPTSSGGGDPHFRTFGNTFFSYHGACDLKLLESLAFANRKGLRVIIRTTYAETQSAQYSYISGVVVQIGEHTFEVESDGSSYLDGELIHEHEEDVSAAIAAPAAEHDDDEEDENVPADKIVSGYKKDTKHLAATGDNTPAHVHLEGIPVTKFSKGKRGNIVTFELKAEGKAVQIRARKDILSVDVSGLFDDAVGLLGTSGQPGMIGRDKITSYDTDWLKYGEEWQIREDEPMLFRHSRFPQHPQKCSYDVDVVAAHGRRLRGIVESEEPVSVEAATEACSGVQDEHMRQFCVDDVMAMGLDMASDPFFSN